MTIVPFPETPLFEDYYALVVYQAKKVHRRLAASGDVRVELSDLIQQGFVGLLDAGSRYDPGKKTRFATFALTRIHGAIVDYLRDQDPLTQRERQKLKELMKARTDLARDLLREPRADEVARHLKISEEEFRKRERLRIVLLSVEDLSSEHSEMEECHANGYNVNHSTPEDAAIARVSEEEKAKLNNDVNDCLEESLEDMERSVLIHRVMEELTLVDLGKLWQTSKDTVWRKERDAKRKMKTCLENKGWEASDVMSLIIQE